MPTDALRALIGRRLERGSRGSFPSRLAASAWAAWSARTVARPLLIPPDVRVIGIGGAVLGGAGKTPVALALARTLAAAGQHPALVSHAYRARPPAPRIVRPDDTLSATGDDALSAARLLAGAAPVVVGPTRQAAVDHAAALGHRLIIVDGLLQTAPRPLAASVLVLDALAPWGAGACPPLGDLRAPTDALLAAANLVVAVLAEGTIPNPALPDDAIPLPSFIGGAFSAREVLALDALRQLQVGLLLAVARPERIVGALERAGIRPEVTVLLGDHADAGKATLAGAARAKVDAWLTTARCATRLPEAIGGRPVLALDHRIDVSGLAGRLATRASG